MNSIRPSDKFIRKIFSKKHEKEEAKRVEILLEMVKYLLSTRKDAEKYTDKNFYHLLENEYMTVLDKIIEKGRAEGEVKGLEKGIEKGIEKGKLETAKNLKAEGIELSVILKVTGLTVEQLNIAGIL